MVDEDNRLCLVLNHLSGGELFDRIVEVRSRKFFMPTLTGSMFLVTILQRGHYSEHDAADLMRTLLEVQLGGATTFVATTHTFLVDAPAAT